MNTITNINPAAIRWEKLPKEMKKYCLSFVDEQGLTQVKKVSKECYQFAWEKLIPTILYFRDLLENNERLLPYRTIDSFIRYYFLKIRQVPIPAGNIERLKWFFRLKTESENIQQDVLCAIASSWDFALKLGRLSYYPLNGPVLKAALRQGLQPTDETIRTCRKIATKNALAILLKKRPESGPEKG